MSTPALLSISRKSSKMAGDHSLQSPTPEQTLCTHEDGLKSRCLTEHLLSDTEVVPARSLRDEVPEHNNELHRCVNQLSTMVQIKGVLRRLGLLDPELSSDTETSSEESLTIPENLSDLEMAKHKIVRVEESSSHPEVAFSASSKIDLEDSTRHPDASLGHDNEAQMFKNRRKTHDKRGVDAKLVAGNSATEKVKSHDDGVAAELGDLTLNEPELSTSVKSGPELPKVGAEEDDMETIKPLKKPKKKNSKKKKVIPSDKASSPASDRTIIATPSNSTLLASFIKPRFGFDDYRDQLRCRRHGCDKLTNCYDGSTVICPRCGVESFHRYCSLQCLLDADMRFHWAQECGQCPLREDDFQLDKRTFIIRPVGLRPYIDCSADNPARHRQAVFHSANGAAGDYFVFNDHSLATNEGRERVAAIGAGEIIATIMILPDYEMYKGRSIFHEVLEACLLTGYSRPDRCLALADIVTRTLVASGQWTPEVQECLVYQMQNEFAYDIPPEIIYRFTIAAPAPTSG